ncbi:golgin subfamily A member 5-like [Gossypium australe]|uniref:Golgin subfamily A member 5-like n=1 Tax=Gossypium australe TaxID=47621 RepID=A0A5B6WQ36_9ROSI|nr:golgin subfamily A member 5-like [Gossypium australe]
MIPDEILYRCGDFDWVPLLGIWGAVGYAPLLVKAVYSTMQGLAQCELAYKCDDYKKKVYEILNAWNQTHKMKRFTANPMTTSEYDWWWDKIINENVYSSNQKSIRSIKEHL